MNNQSLAPFKLLPIVLYKSSYNTDELLLKKIWHYNHLIMVNLDEDLQNNEYSDFDNFKNSWCSKFKSYGITDEELNNVIFMFNNSSLLDTPLSIIDHIFLTFIKNKKHAISSIAYSHVMWFSNEMDIINSLDKLIEAAKNSYNKKETKLIFKLSNEESSCPLASIVYTFSFKYLTDDMIYCNESQDYNHIIDYKPIQLNFNK